MKVKFGGRDHEKIEIEVLNYESPSPTGDPFDDNWLSVNCRVKAGGFSGYASMSLLADDPERFLQQLEPLFINPHGEAQFETMEGQLEFTIKGDGNGRFKLTGLVMDQAGIGNRLNFHFDLDQTQLAESIAQLKQVIAKFPSR